MTEIGKIIKCKDCSKEIVKTSWNRIRCADCSHVAKTKNTLRYYYLNGGNPGRNERYPHLKDRRRKWNKDWWIKWSKTPKGIAYKLNSNSNRRKAMSGKVTGKEIMDLYKKYEWMCLCCKRKKPEIKLTIDHIKPLHLGGKNIIENLQPLCKSCNSSKGTKEIDYRPLMELKRSQSS